MDLGNAANIRLEPQDEYMHPIEDATNFNESMYINCFDHENKMGGWFRVGNRPNEGHAEMSCCVYLPDGRVGFMFQRPSLNHNDALDSAGMKFTVITPFSHLRVTYEGELCLLDTPQDMDNPATAFSQNPKAKAKISIDFFNIAPVYGGEMVDENGHPIEEAPEESFARAHYEQHMKAEGVIQIGNEHYPINGLGMRDHSWGPRYWQNLYWYRWLPMCFSEDFAMNISIVTMATGKQHVWGMVLRVDEHGEKDYMLIDDATITSTLDEHNQAIGQEIWVKTQEREYTIKGNALSLIPLRNRRKLPNGEQLNTRITEAMTRFVCDGLVGYGMSEYLDQIVEGSPVGITC